MPINIVALENSITFVDFLTAMEMYTMSYVLIFMKKYTIQGINGKPGTYSIYLCYHIEYKYCIFCHIKYLTFDFNYIMKEIYRQTVQSAFELQQNFINKEYQHPVRMT